MNTITRTAVVGLVALVVLGLGMATTAGAHGTDPVADPVSTVGHVCDQWGWHNDWGDHRHGDHWTDHPHQPGAPGDGPHGPHDGPHGPHQGAGPHHGSGPYHGPGR